MIWAISSLRPEGINRLSNPFLVNCLPSYRKSKRKVLFVGQETNGWDSFTITLDTFNYADESLKRDAIINYLQWMYEDFRIQRKSNHTAFWRGMRRLYQSISNDESDDAFLHTQLVRFDYNKKRPTLSVEDLLQEEFNVLPMEISALAPDIVVFLTGPNYDERIIKTFSNVYAKGKQLVFEVENGYQFNELARLSHPDLPYHTYRTYHPIYPLRNNPDLFK